MRYKQVPARALLLTSPSALGTAVSMLLYLCSVHTTHNVQGLEVKDNEP
jgi:hypothetical protein